MQIELFAGLSRLFLLGIIIASASLQPELSITAVRPILILWFRFKLFRIAIASRLRSTHRERFWEIDMTKFEP